MLEVEAWLAIWVETRPFTTFCPKPKALPTKAVQRPLRHEANLCRYATRWQSRGSADVAGRRRHVGPRASPHFRLCLGQTFSTEPAFPGRADASRATAEIPVATNRCCCEARRVSRFVRGSLGHQALQDSDAHGRLSLIIAASRPGRFLGTLLGRRSSHTSGCCTRCPRTSARKAPPRNTSSKTAVERHRSHLPMSQGVGLPRLKGCSH